MMKVKANLKGNLNSLDQGVAPEEFKNALFVIKLDRIIGRLKKIEC